MEKKMEGCFHDGLQKLYATDAGLFCWRHWSIIVICTRYWTHNAVYRPSFANTSVTL